jgi:hypothetical protein
MAILHRLTLGGPVTMPEPYRYLKCIFVVMLFASSDAWQVVIQNKALDLIPFSVGGQSVRFDPRYAKLP